MQGDVRDPVYVPDPCRPGPSNSLADHRGCLSMFSHTPNKHMSQQCYISSQDDENPHMKSCQAAHRLFTSAFCGFLALVATSGPDIIILPLM